MAIDLVTGATGLVGANLVRTLLTEGRRVRVLHRPTSDLAVLDGLEGVEFVPGDVRALPSVVNASEGAEDVYHCAALVSMWAGMADVMRQVNVGGTKNILEAATRNQVRRVIYCSSVDAIGLPESDEPSDEDVAWNWDRLGVANPYARTKLEAQQAVLDVAGRELDAVVVNPTYMFGAYDPRPSSGQLILEIAAGRLPGYTGGGNNFVDVEDVVEAMVAAARLGRCGECYILGNENLSYREISRRIASLLDVAPPRFELPYALARVGGRMGDLFGRLTGKEPAVNSDIVKMGYVNHYYSSRKAIEELGMKQSPVDGAIARAIEWFRKQRMLPAV